MTGFGEPRVDVLDGFVPALRQGRARSRVATLVIALLAGAIAAGLTVAWWQARQDEQVRVSQVRLTAWATPVEPIGAVAGSCVSVPVILANLGERPVVLLRLDADLSGVRRTPDCARPASDIDVRIGPSRSLSWSLRYGIACGEPVRDQTYRAVVRTADGIRRSVTGPVSLAVPVVSPAVCAASQPALRLANLGEPSLVGTGRATVLRIPVQLIASRPGEAFGDAHAGIAVQSLATAAGSAFSITTKGLPIRLGDGEGRFVELHVTVSDCARAQELADTDLTLRAESVPRASVQGGIAEGQASGAVATGLVHLVDAACGPP
jgi:hypothetical protein